MGLALFVSEANYAADKQAATTRAAMGEIVEMASATTHPVTITLKGATHRITLSNPPTNALSIATLDALASALDAARGDAGCRVVVLAAAGGVFSSGLDLKEMTARRGDEDGGRAFFDATVRLLSGLCQAIVRHPKPVIAEVTGVVTAAGCGLVASCDLAIAAENATFSTPDVNIGLFCSMPMVALSRTMSRKHAMEMLLTGETIDARTAREFGLVNRVVPPEYLTTVVEKYATSIASKAPSAIRAGKEAFYDQIELGLGDAYDHATNVMVEGMMSADAMEGIAAAFEKREARWSGQ